MYVLAMRSLLGIQCIVSRSSGQHANLPASRKSSSSSVNDGVGGGISGTLLEVRQLWTLEEREPVVASSRPTRQTMAAPSVIVGDAIPAEMAEASVTFDTQVRRTGPELSVAPLLSTAAATSSLVTETGSSSPRLFGFVRVKEADHRLSGWMPLAHIYVKASLLVGLLQEGQKQQLTRDGASTEHGCSGSTVPSSLAAFLSFPAAELPPYIALSAVVQHPILSSLYDEVTQGMARTQRAKRQLDYLEERLLRDCRTPTTIRYFVYLNVYVFPPWYFAPYGLLNPEYDPMRPETLPFCTGGCATSGDRLQPCTSAAALPASPHPFLRDAFLCPFSLRIFSTHEQLCYETQTYRAERLRPPGDEIYRDNERGLSLFKVNGNQHRTYCRHLFLLGKSFLENKLAGHDVDNYFFYVVCLHHRYFPAYIDDPSAMYVAGYFSWEKHVEDYNLACIATLPCFGRRPKRGGREASTMPPPVLRNIGQFMIAVSYELSYRRKQIGTPEKPLSDLGTIAYQHYWRRVLLRWMKKTLNEMRWASAVSVDTPEEAAAHEGSDVYALEVVGKGRATERDVLLAGGSDIEDDDTSTDGAPARPQSKKRSRMEVATPSKVAINRIRGEEGRSPTSSRAVALPSAHPTQPQRQRVTIKEIAAEVRLEEADVLKTLLAMGLLHRTSEDQSTLLLLPQRYVDWAYDELLRWERSSENAVFYPALLQLRGR